MSLRNLRARLASPVTPVTRDKNRDVTEKNYIKQFSDIKDTSDTTKTRNVFATGLNSVLASTLAQVCSDLPLTSRDIYEAFAPEDIAAWQAGEISPGVLRAFAVAVHESRERGAGRVPDSYEDAANCRQCGPVWLFTEGDVQSCPWCINRMAGLPIPRPNLVTCATCRHFRRADHPNIGRCAVGVRSAAPAGLWDTDLRSCGRWLAHRDE